MPRRSPAPTTPSTAAGLRNKDTSPFPRCEEISRALASGQGTARANIAVHPARALRKDLFADADVVAGHELRPEQPEQRLAEGEQPRCRREGRPEGPVDGVCHVGRSPHLTAKRIVFGASGRPRPGRRRGQILAAQAGRLWLRLESAAAGSDGECRATAARSSLSTIISRTGWVRP